MFEAIEQLIEAQTIGPFTMAYGGPATLSLLSGSCQVVSQDNDELEFIFVDENFELLQGSR